MKHATFKDFIREAYYHGANLALEADIIENHPPHAWQTVRDMLERREFDKVEACLKDIVRSLTIPGVCTYWPNEAQAAAAYLAQVLPPEPYDGRFNG